MPQADPDWSDLAGTWHAAAAQVTSGDIEAYLQRQRRQLLLVTVVELLVSLVGMLAALWLVFTPRFLWMGLLIEAFAVPAAIMLLRAGRRRGPGGTTDLLESLRQSIAWQEWRQHELRFGRALHLIALLPVVSVLSVQLRDFQGTSATAFAASLAAALGVLVALGWNSLLMRRARRRGARLRLIATKLAE